MPTGRQPRSELAFRGHTGRLHSDTLERLSATIDGTHRFDPGSASPTFNPATAEQIGLVHQCTAGDVDRAVRSARLAADAWREVPLAERRGVLHRTAELLAAERDDLVELVVRDTGATVRTAGPLQVDPAIARLRWWASQPDEVLWPAAVASTEFGCMIERAPVGVVACISPYNFPLLSMVGKVAPALFAGDAAVLKPAPQAPLLVGRLVRALGTALADAGAPAAVVSLITGESPDLGAHLVAHPDIGSVTFTGSTAVGRLIAKSCAERFVPVVLELGGKGALIARDDADVDAVVAALLETWTIQAGQRCRTPTRLLAYPAVHDAIVDRLCTELAQVVVGDPSDPRTDVGPVISERQADAIETAVATAVAAGRVVERGHAPDSAGWFAAPALVLDCRSDDPIMVEEVFGPVIAVTRVSDDDDAVHVANATAYGLTDYVYGADVEGALRVGRRLRTGGVGINTSRRYEHAPFGGVGDSGIGREGGLFSLEACTVRRAYVLVDPSQDIL